jgi:hypothetical protein
MKPQHLWWMFVVVLAAMAATWTYAQSVQVNPVTPTVLSGADIGFRVEGYRGGTPVGSLVVKLNGQWVATDFNSPRLPQRISAK